MAAEAERGIQAQLLRHDVGRIGVFPGDAGLRLGLRLARHGWASLLVWGISGIRVRARLRPGRRKNGTKCGGAQAGMCFLLSNSGGRLMIWRTRASDVFPAPLFEIDMKEKALITRLFQPPIDMSKVSTLVYHLPDGPALSLEMNGGEIFFDPDMELGDICDTTEIDGVLHFFPKGNA